MTARLMTPFCFASLLAAALIAEGALLPHMPAETVRPRPSPSAFPADQLMLNPLPLNTENLARND